MLSILDCLTPALSNFALVWEVTRDLLERCTEDIVSTDDTCLSVCLTRLETSNLPTPDAINAGQSLPDAAIMYD